MQYLQSVESPISHKLDCLEKCDHQNFFKVQEEVLVAIQISLSDGDTISPWERLPQSVWSSRQFQSHKLGSVLVEMQFLPSIGSSIPHKLDCLKLFDRKKKYKSKLGGGFGSNAIFTQLEVQFPKCLK